MQEKLVKAPFLILQHSIQSTIKVSRVIYSSYVFYFTVKSSRLSHILTRYIYSPTNKNYITCFIPQLSFRYFACAIVLRSFNYIIWRVEMQFVS